MRCAIAAALLAAAMLTGAAPAAGDPQAIAGGFYAAYVKYHLGNGIPDAAGQEKLAPFVSPALAALLDVAGNAGRKFAQENKGAPALVEGDLFTSMFEGASEAAVRACRIEAQTASCSVDLAQAQGKSFVRWSDTVYLVDTKAGWRVDDVAYGGEGRYANQGRLTTTLRQVISDAGN
jgi:hypothetical protein